MSDSPIKGKFSVLESFAVYNRKEFYMMGQVLEGEVEANWFVIVPFNASFGMTARISKVEEIVLAGRKESFHLLTFDGDAEMLDLMLDMNIGGEILKISSEGSD